MCGIAGKFNVSRDEPVRAHVVAAMTRALEHRGPDDEGVWVEGRIGLGNRRLAVIDLSERAHQPMSNEDGSLWIAYNGEVYGFTDLRRELEQHGHRFRSASDTEVILHAYEQFGEECLGRLRGMFAFAVWDARQQSLFVARDRVGKKPLFYYWDGRTLAFASEVRALLQDPSVPIEADPIGIHEYVTYGYVPAPRSAFRNVRKLPAGHFMVVRDGRLRVQRYWKLSYAPKWRGTEDSLCEQLMSLLDEAVRLRLVSDVPVGALLSGGVDSSIVVATMRRHVSGPLKTFSIGFAEAKYNEAEYAREVARRFETDHQEFVVRPRAADLIPAIAWHYGEPFADSSALPSLIVCRMARQQVTVALNGDGGDESFLGYERYAAVRLAGALDWLPGSVRRRLSVSAHMRTPGSKSRLHRLQRFVSVLGEEPRRRYARWLVFFDEERRRDLYSSAFHDQMSRHDPLSVLFQAYAASDAPDFVEQSANTDVELYLPDDLLVKMDIASMANSLELRSPLLDHRLMEFAARLPRRLKLRGTTGKYLLKKAFRGTLPTRVLYRPKMGFGIPIDAWFRTDLRALAYDTLLDTRAASRGYFRPEVVRRYLDEHISGRGHHQYRIWNLLMLELWHRTYLETPRTEISSLAPDLSAVRLA